MKVGHFDICKVMALENQDIKVAPLGNITNLRKTKAGTEVTIGISGDEVAAIAIENRYIGGLMLINREQYFATKKRLEDELIAGPMLEENL